jgi:hypothetical protein
METTYMSVRGFHSKAIEKKISAAADATNGKFDCVTDKGVVFKFDGAGAWTFRANLRTFGVFAEQIDG